MRRVKRLLFQRQVQETSMEENKPVPVEKTEADVSFDKIHAIHPFHKYSLTCVITLKPLASQVREADEKEDTVAMPPPQEIERMEEQKLKSKFPGAPGNVFG